MFWFLQTNRRKYIWLLGLLALLLIVLAAPWKLAMAAGTSVTLVEFTAEGSSDEEGIILRWSTASELDNAGFYLQRSLNASSGFARLDIEGDGEVDFFAAEGGQIGVDYERIDLSAQQDVRYFYKLEALDTSGNSEIYGPINAMYVGLNTPAPTAIPTQADTPTPTATQTQTPTATQIGASTATVTPTPTATQIGATAQPTATRTPTRTQASAASQTSVPSATLTPEVTATLHPGVEVTATLVPSPTTTLEPLPPIALLFPDSGNNVTVQAPVITVIAVTQVAPQAFLEANQDVSVRLRVIGAVVAALWLTLAALVVVFFRKMNQ